MTNHKVTAFADYDAFKVYVDAIVSTTSIQVMFSPAKRGVVVE